MKLQPLKLAVEVVRDGLIDRRPTAVSTSHETPRLGISVVAQCAIVLCATDNHSASRVTSAAVELGNPEIVVEFGSSDKSCVDVGRAEDPAVIPEVNSLVGAAIKSGVFNYRVLVRVNAPKL